MRKFMIIFALFITACDQGSDSVEVTYTEISWEHFEGTWADSSDSYTIQDGHLYYDDGFDGGDWESNFDGSIVAAYRFDISTTKSLSGVLIIEIGDAYTAVYFRNQSETQMDLSTAYYEGEVFPFTKPTKSDAIAAFVSIEARKRYVGWWGGPYVLE